MQLCSTASPQVLTQLTASHAVLSDGLFPFFPTTIISLTLGKYHWLSPRPVSPSQHMLPHIHWVLTSRVLHSFPKEIWRNSSPRALFLLSPFGRWAHFSIPQLPALPHAPYPLLQCPGGCLSWKLFLKAKGQRENLTKPQKTCSAGIPLCNTRAVLLSLEPRACPKPAPTKCLLVTPSCTPLAALPPPPLPPTAHLSDAEQISQNLSAIQFSPVVQTSVVENTNETLFLSMKEKLVQFFPSQ